MATGDTIVPPGLLSSLLARNKSNVLPTRALVAAAQATMLLVRRKRRPRLAGGSDNVESAGPHVGDARVIRTWAKVKAGALPTDGAKRRWVGPGRGERCDGCGDPIDSHETELEIDFRNALLLRFHVGCFKTWEHFDGQRW
jgi:hypothetical protein